jgi:hypothetical protein
MPADWPSGGRHRGGASRACGTGVERGNRAVDAKGALPTWMPTEGLSTDAIARGGQARSSGDLS